MISNWDFSLVLAISELLVDPQQPSSLLDIKLHAFQKAKDLMLQYEKRGIRRDLLDVILDKKIKLILKAETANPNRQSQCTTMVPGEKIHSPFRRRSLRCGRSFRPTTC